MGLPEKTHFLKAVVSEHTPWQVASLIGQGEVEGEFETALSGSTWVLKEAWAGAHMYHIGWRNAVRRLGAICLSVGVMRGKRRL